MYSPEIQTRLAILTQKSLDGTLTLEECREAVQIMHGDRERALRASPPTAKRAKAHAEIKHADDMLDELLGDGE